MSNTLLDRIRLASRRVFFWLPSSTPHEEQPPESLHDHHLVIAVTNPERLPRIRQIRYALRVFSPTEQRIITICLVLMSVALGTAGASLLRERVVSVPVVGGSITEALVGQPKYLNPLDAPTNDVDSDLTELMYSGLFRMDALEPIPDLAEQYSWSDDRKTLTVKIRTDARFHDGEPVTAEDIRFTYDSVQNPARKSPLAPLYRGITLSVDDASTVRFTLEKADASFLSKLTLGILPSHLWQEVPAGNAKLSGLNTKPVGSGPYRVKSFLHDNLGNIHSYTLERFERFYGVTPYLSTIVFQFYDERQGALDAFKSDLVDSVSFVSTDDASKVTPSRAHDVKLHLPEESIAFFNLKDKTLSAKEVREALSLAIDRTDIVAALQDGADIVSGPYPFGTVTSTTPNLARARDILTAAGWVVPQNSNIRIWAPVKKAVPAPTPTSRNRTTAPAPVTTPATTTAATLATPSSTELAVTINVPDEPDLIAIAEVLKRQWSLIGAHVTVEAMPTEELMRKATRDRNLQVVLLNIFLGPEQDLFPFWWSGQNVDRGLNISQLSDRNVDDALDATRNATTTESLLAAREKVSHTLAPINAAAFLVRPTHHDLVSSRIKGVKEDLTITHPSERLIDVLRWYTKTGWRWK